MENETILEVKEEKFSKQVAKEAIVGFIRGAAVAVGVLTPIVLLGVATNALRPKDQTTVDTNDTETNE